MNKELRGVNVTPELRSDHGKKTAKGYAAIFNSRTNIGGFFEEQIAPGAFSDAIKSDVRALIDHDSGRVIGRTTSGTLRLMEDERGLAVEIDLPDTTDGRDLAVQLERGDITGMSFGFHVTREEWDETGATPLRTIRKVDLIEVSAVAFPAYGDTAIGLRSLEHARAERRRHNFNAASTRLRMKTTLDLASRSKAKA